MALHHRIDLVYFNDYNDFEYTCQCRKIRVSEDDKHHTVILCDYHIFEGIHFVTLWQAVMIIEQSAREVFYHIEPERFMYRIWNRCLQNCSDKRCETFEKIENVCKCL